MDFHLNKQWRNQQYESENQHQHSAKIPKLLSNNLLHEPNPQYQKPELPSGSALSLFVPQVQPNTTNKISTHLSSHPFPDHSTPTPTPSTTSRSLPSNLIFPSLFLFHIHKYMHNKKSLNLWYARNTFLNFRFWVLCNGPKELDGH